MEIIVDLFNQHSGDIAELKRAALAAWMAGADTVKIQLLNSKRIWGDDSRKHLEMSKDQFEDFCEFCDKHDIPLMASVFDEGRFDWLLQNRITRFKIAACTLNNDYDLAMRICEEQRETLVSFNPDSAETPERLIKEWPKVVPLFCVSKYPAGDTDVRFLPDKMGAGETYHGFSDHFRDTPMARQAYIRGATILEKHFTFSRYIKSDTEKAHICSFTPESLRQFKNWMRIQQCAG